MGKVILFTVLSIVVPPSQAARMDSAEINAGIIEINALVNESSEPLIVPWVKDHDCECGLSNYFGTTILGEEVEFTIGEGFAEGYEPSGGLPYETLPTAGKCLSKCFAPPVGRSMQCASQGYEFRKVARQHLGKKLCCKVQQCTWRKDERQWVPMKDFEKYQVVPDTYEETHKWYLGRTLKDILVDNRKLPKVIMHGNPSWDTACNLKKQLVNFFQGKPANDGIPVSCLDVDTDLCNEGLRVLTSLQAEAVLNDLPKPC